MRPSFTRRRKSSASVCALLAALGSFRFSNVISCKSDLGGVFWLEAARHQFSCAGGETLRIRKRGRFTVQRTIVLLKLAGSQPIVCTLRILIGQH